MTVPIAWQFFYWLWVGSEIVVGIATRTKQSSGKVRDRGSLVLLWIVIFVSITVGTGISEVTPPDMFGGARFLKILGLAILILGLVIRWLAIFTLGRSFSSNVAIRDSQTLNRAGLYRVIRHPSYLGLLIVFIAIGVHSRNWLSFAIVLIPTTAALLYRIRVEETALVQAFGDDYVAYSQTTKRLIPGLF